MEQVTIDTYSFNELSDEAKARAIEWYRGTMGDSGEVVDHVSEEFERMLEERKLDWLTIPQWNCSYDQGAFVWFQGWSDVRKVPALSEVVDQLDKDYASAWEADLTIYSRGNYCQNIVSVDSRYYGDDPEDTVYLRIAELLEKAAEDWIKGIEREFQQAGRDLIDCVEGDENVSENIRANEYRFSINGSRSVTL